MLSSLLVKLLRCDGLQSQQIWHYNIMITCMHIGRACVYNLSYIYNNVMPRHAKIAC